MTALIISGVNALAIFVLIIQAFYSYKQTKLSVEQTRLLKEQIEKTHEQERRNNTVNVMFSFVQSIRKETAFAEKIAERLNEEQCRCLYMQQEFTVTADIKRMLCEICPNNKEDCEECKKQEGLYIVKDLQLSELRWYVISYLNMLETVMVAWQQGAVDNKIIESEFAYLYNAERGRNALENFRKIAGNGSSFPLVEMFCNELREKSKVKTNRKGDL